jgi:hypothetical protein
LSDADKVIGESYGDVCHFGMPPTANAYDAAFGQSQNVVTDWITIASMTILTNGRVAAVASGVWLAYTSIAVCDAVNAVHRLYQPYFDGIAPGPALF